MPERFFTMARQVREGVARFNGAARLQKVLNYMESPAVTTRDPNPARDFLVEIRRDPNHCLFAMRQLWRLGQDDALIIEGEGRVGREPNVQRFKLRIDGRVRDGQLGWRITSDGKEVDTPIDEIGERLVAVVATGELSRLWTSAPFLDKPAAPAGDGK